ncbi:MAG: pilus assembly protein TadG-related protein, partial [Desulfobulbaceae bacterium]|nr:pilus assembly protein TadG-related protein [Desulfobulbaceae bacterium]
MKTITSGREQGAVAPLVAILIVLFILCIALVVDLGHLHNVKVQLQRAVDAAALAGARQLDGSTGQDDRARAVARATANANRIDSDSGWITDDNPDIELGNWDTKITGASPADRFDSEDTPINAIRVTATLEVDNIFFFPTVNSTVSADAIAVNMYKETALPIALLSCIPINEGAGQTVCDIQFYIWGSDPLDTAGWTSLTYGPGVNADDLKRFFEPGNTEVKQIIYGDGSGDEGLENEDVRKGDGTYDADSSPCDLTVNNGLTIACGLGDEFVPPALAPDDPLDYDPLPRWDYNLDEDADLSDDPFRRIYSMDGILEQGYIAGESDSDYEARLETLKNASEDYATGDHLTAFNTYDTNYPSPILPDWARDGRWDVMVSKKGEALFEQALLYAGYPAVAATNGTDASVLKAFLELTTEGQDDGHFDTSLTSITPPLDATESSDPSNSYGGGETFAVTIPIVLTGACQDTAYNAMFPYVGT